TGPDVVKTVTHEDVTSEELGGARVHAEVSGVAHFTAPDDAACLLQVRELLGYLPLNNADDPPLRPSDDHPNRMDEALDSFVTESSDQPYDMRQVIKKVVDQGRFPEVHSRFGAKLVTGFARPA